MLCAASPLWSWPIQRQWSELTDTLPALQRTFCSSLCSSAAGLTIGDSISPVKCQYGSAASSHCLVYVLLPNVPPLNPFLICLLFCIGGNRDYSVALCGIARWSGVADVQIVTQRRAVFFSRVVSCCLDLIFFFSFIFCSCFPVPTDSNMLRHQVGRTVLFVSPAVLQCGFYFYEMIYDDLTKCIFRVLK